MLISAAASALDMPSRRRPAAAVATACRSPHHPPLPFAFRLTPVTLNHTPHLQHRLRRGCGAAGCDSHRQRPLCCRRCARTHAPGHARRLRYALLLLPLLLAPTGSCSRLASSVPAMCRGLWAAAQPCNLCRSPDPPTLLSPPAQQLPLGPFVLCRRAAGRLCAVARQPALLPGTLLLHFAPVLSTSWQSA